MNKNNAVVDENVTVDNFVRAETDMTLKRYVAQGGFGKIVHVRQPATIEEVRRILLAHLRKENQSNRP